MARNLKGFWLALVAALAMSAVAAASAYGTWEVELEAEVEWFFTGTQITHNAKSFHIIKVGKSEVKCEEAFFTGQVIGNKIEKMTFTPTYNKCKTETGLPVTITTNGCDYTFYAGTKSDTNPDHYIDGAMDIDCPGEAKKMEIHIYSSATNHSNGTSMCTATIPEQSVLVATTYTNTPKATPADVDLTTEIDLKDEIHGNPFLCGTGENGTYTGATTLRAFTDAAHSKPIKFLKVS